KYYLFPPKPRNSVPHAQSSAREGATMSTRPVPTKDPASDPKAAKIDLKAAPVDMRFEIVVLTVSDVDRAKDFYKSLGWRLDADSPHEHDLRVIQFPPRGSGR